MSTVQVDLAQRTAHGTPRVPGLPADGASRLDAMRAAASPTCGSGPGSGERISLANLAFERL